MMNSLRIGVISDIHANLHALQSVIQHARHLKVDEIWNAGDLVGYGAFPNEVIEFVHFEQIQSIKGNYDAKVLKIPRKENIWANSKNPVKWFAMKWAYHTLNKNNKKILKSLPEKISLQRVGWRILLLHGSPASSEEPLGPETSIDRLQQLSDNVDDRIIICGHSHAAFFRQVSDKYFLNPGSVGRQDDGDPRASYAILDLSESDLQVTFHRIIYNYKEAAQAVRNYGLHEAFAQILLNGTGFQNL